MEEAWVLERARKFKINRRKRRAAALECIARLENEVGRRDLGLNQMIFFMSFSVQVEELVAHCAPFLAIEHKEQQPELEFDPEQSSEEEVEEQEDEEKDQESERESGHEGEEESLEDLMAELSAVMERLRARQEQMKKEDDCHKSSEDGEEEAESVSTCIPSSRNSQCDVEVQEEQD